MASTAARVAIERKSTDPISRKLHELTRAGVNWPRIYSQMQELETVGDILRENTQPHLLALLYFDLRRAPATPFKDPGHEQNLPGSGMWRSLKKVRVQHRRRQYHDDPTRARANALKKRGELQLSISSLPSTKTSRILRQLHLLAAGDFQASLEYVVMSAGTLCYDIRVVDLESGLCECLDVVELGPFEVSCASRIHAHLDSVIL